MLVKELNQRCLLLNKFAGKSHDPVPKDTHVLVGHRILIAGTTPAMIQPMRSFDHFRHSSSDVVTAMFDMLCGILRLMA